MINVGIRLAGQPHDLTGWLQDGAAFDAAGAYALWVDTSEAPELDTLALTAALAAVTFRSLLVASVPAQDLRSADAARRLSTVARLSHGRLGLLTELAAGELADDLTIAIEVFTRMPGSGAGAETFERADDGQSVQRWLSASVPESRAAWRDTVGAASEQGYAGLVVSAHPRLLDLLRNPDDPDERRDLYLAMG